MDKLCEWLAANVPDESSAPTVIVHGDYRLDNIVFHSASPRPLALLDFELCTLGHPLADLAYSCMVYYMPHDFHSYRGMKGVPASQLEGLPSLAEYVASYVRWTSHPPDLTHWNFYCALSFFRAAAILQGVYKRSLQGNASSARAREVGFQAEAMARLGAECAFGAPLTLNMPLQSSSACTAPPASSTAAFQASLRGAEVVKKVQAFMEREIYPVEGEYRRLVKESCKAGQIPWRPPPLLDSLKAKAKALGLWNLFLPLNSPHGTGPGLSNLDYAHVCQLLGRCAFLAPEVLNCNAPDTGNMEVLMHFGSADQKAKWLTPLLNGDIRSCFCMTEPDVASSDATNMATTIVRSGESYIVNGRKWWSTGAANERCKVAIVMGRTASIDSKLPKHKQHAMIIVPMDAVGVKVVRSLSVFGYEDPPLGHCEVVFNQVRVPVSNLLLGEGRGFEIAQGRLGPGRAAHCMRVVGLVDRCFETTVERVLQRRAFGTALAEKGLVLNQIAQCRVELEQARLLVLYAAQQMDLLGSKAAAREIAMIKVVVPTAGCRVIDRCIQMHGAAGLCDDFILAEAYAGVRSLRIADGPDEVHLETIAKMEFRKRAEKKARL